MYLYLLKKLGGWNSVFYVDFSIKTLFVIVRFVMKKDNL